MIKRKCRRVKGGKGIEIELGFLNLNLNRIIRLPYCERPTDRKRAARKVVMEQAAGVKKCPFKRGEDLLSNERQERATHDCREKRSGLVGAASLHQLKKRRADRLSRRVRKESEAIDREKSVRRILFSLYTVVSVSHTR